METPAHCSREAEDADKNKTMRHECLFGWFHIVTGEDVMCYLQLFSWWHLLGGAHCLKMPETLNRHASNKGSLSWKTFVPNSVWHSESRLYESELLQVRASNAAQEPEGACQRLHPTGWMALNIAVKSVITHLVSVTYIFMVWWCQHWLTTTSKKT